MALKPYLVGRWDRNEGTDIRCSRPNPLHIKPPGGDKPTNRSDEVINNIDRLGCEASDQWSVVSCNGQMTPDYGQMTISQNTMKRKVRFQAVLITLLVLTVGVPAVPQSKRRQKQIEGLIKKSDLVVLAVAQAYYPVIDIEKYRLEREGREDTDPRQRSKYTVGTVYKLSIKEVLFQKSPKDPNNPKRIFYPDDNIMIYVPGPPAHPLDFGKITFLPGTEYLAFLKQINLDPDDFRRGVRQDVNAPMREWESFPNPAETYFEVVRDSLAAKPIDEVWEKFADQTRAVARAISSQK